MTFLLQLQAQKPIPKRIRTQLLHFSLADTYVCFQVELQASTLPLDELVPKLEAYTYELVGLRNYEAMFQCCVPAHCYPHVCSSRMSHQVRVPQWPWLLPSYCCLAAAMMRLVDEGYHAARFFCLFPPIRTFKTVSPLLCPVNATSRGKTRSTAEAT